MKCDLLPSVAEKAPSVMEESEEMEVVVVLFFVFLLLF